MAGERSFAIFGLSGIAASFFAGLSGIGGGLIMVPALVYAFNTTGMATEHVVTMALEWSHERMLPTFDKCRGQSVRESRLTSTTG